MDTTNTATIRLVEERLRAIDDHLVSTMQGIWENTNSTPDWARALLDEREELWLDHYDLRVRLGTA